MLTINDRTVPMLPHQERFTNLDCRNPGLIGGLGCGKSRALLTRGPIMAGFEEPGLIGIYACLTYPLLRDAIIPELRRILGDYDLREGLDWDLNISSMTFTLWIAQDADGNPSRTYFRPVQGVGNLSRLIAITAAWACLDEAGSMSNEAQRRITERVRDKRCKRPFIACGTSPEGLNWLYDVYVVEPRARAAAAGLTCGVVDDEAFRFVRGRTEDNPHLDPGYVDALRKRYDSRLVDAYLEGLFVPMFEGRCFRFNEHEHLDREAEYDPYLPICASFDFNVNPMSVTLNQHKGDEFWTFDEISLRGSDTEAACAALLDKYGDHANGLRIYGDAGGHSRSTKARWTDYQIIKQMLGHMDGFRECVARVNPSQRDSVNEVNAVLKNGYGVISYKVHPRCGATIRSFLTTRWDQNTGGIFKNKNATSGTEVSQEDPTDTIRYWIHEVRPIERSLRRGAPQRRAGRVVHA